MCVWWVRGVGGVDVGRVDGVGIWSVVRVTVLCWWTWLFMVALLLMVLSFEVAASNWRRLMTASRPRGLLLVLALFGVSSCCEAVARQIHGLDTEDFARRVPNFYFLFK